MKSNKPENDKRQFYQKKAVTLFWENEYNIYSNKTDQNKDNLPVLSLLSLKSVSKAKETLE